MNTATEITLDLNDNEGRIDPSSLPGSVRATAPTMSASEAIEHIRKLFKERMAQDGREKSAYDDQLESSALTYVVEGYPVAVLLMEEGNTALLNQELKNKGMTPAVGRTQRLRQIAQLQLGEWSADGKTWAVPARRDERLGRLYDALYRQESRWPVDPVLLKAAILAYKGETGKKLGKLAGIEADYLESRKDPEAVKKADRARDAVYREATTSDFAARRVELADVRPDAGKWRIALVSVHDGGVVVHELLEKQDALVKKASETYCKPLHAEIIERTLDKADA